jgi:hypothetical protein
LNRHDAKTAMEIQNRKRNWARETELILLVYRHSGFLGGHGVMAVDLGFLECQG